MYKYYCIKIILKDNSIGYYSGMTTGTPCISSDINESCFYDTTGEAYSVYQQFFKGRNWTFDGVGILTASIVEVTSQNRL